MLAVILVFSYPAQAVSARSAILMDAQTGRVLYERMPNQQSLIASTTKIMTALVVCEQCNVLDRMQIPKEAVGVEGSSMYLREGEILTIQELLYGLMLHSGNDAAVALAIYRLCRKPSKRQKGKSIIANSDIPVNTFQPIFSR